MNSNSYIAISGNIGSGKTSLCKYLEEAVENSMVIYEKFEENAYLEKFYDHLKTHGLVYNPYSYATQLTFLQGRIRQEIELFSSNNVGPAIRTFIVDRSIHEDSAVFAQSQFNSGLMSLEEHSKYCQFFNESCNTIRLPNLVIHLKISPKKLHERIQKRGREMEKDISEEYLSNLQSLYQTYIDDMRKRGVEVLEIGTENRDQYPVVLDRIRKLTSN